MAFASGQASSTLSDGMIFCQVVDSLSGESLPFANIINENRPNRSLVADENGCFRIPKSRKLDRWRVEYTGYVSRPLEIAADDYELRIMMEPASTDLQEIVVRPKKKKYSKKNNPAVDFVRKIREASKDHDPANSPFYSYDKYEKSVIALNDFNGDFESGFLGKKVIS